tara:strand:- start:1292 stop:1879 length:588 start_codon:yes stop_codon:yes gene_type:complete
MNIFILHENPKEAAIMHCERHILKMIIEHTQMLAAAYYHTIGISRKKEIAENQEKVSQLFKGFPRKDEDGNDKPYAITHVNHPCTVWTRESLTNFNWLLDCTKYMCEEFTHRYGGKHSVEFIIDWMYQNPPKLKDIGQTEFAQAMPEIYKSDNVTEAYRKYYAYKTTYMKVNWKLEERIPYWWTESFIKESVNLY